ncbi:MAG: hypothetical protein PVJ39_06535 [Gammaproteobacteria bacterium]|jgi:uncharacterized Zn-finger protein
MSVLARLFSGKSTTPKQVYQPKNFVECLDTVHVWNTQVTYDLDVDMDDPKLQAAMNTLVTCPYCSESYYFAEAIDSNNAKLSVECPHCHAKPTDDNEEYVA